MLSSAPAPSTYYLFKILNDFCTFFVGGGGPVLVTRFCSRASFANARAFRAREIGFAGLVENCLAHVALTRAKKGGRVGVGLGNFFGLWLAVPALQCELQMNR